MSLFQISAWKVKICVMRLSNELVLVLFIVKLWLGWLTFTFDCNFYTSYRMAVSCGVVCCIIVCYIKAFAFGHLLLGINDQKREALFVKILWAVIYAFCIGFQFNLEKSLADVVLLWCSFNDLLRHIWYLYGTSCRNRFCLNRFILWIA